MVRTGSLFYQLFKDLYVVVPLHPAVCACVDEDRRGSNIIISKMLILSNVPVNDK